MTAILNFRGACTDDLKIIKTMGDKLNPMKHGMIYIVIQHGRGLLLAPPPIYLENYT